MKRRSILLAVAVGLTLAGPALQGCVTNPATGGTTFTGGLSTAEEVRVGRESHPKIVAEFGGAYGTPELKRYVDSLGQLIARTGERPDLKYTFTILNSDIVNAFAMPGGYIYISRGLLALADDEAQLAAVLAHELGHITALHHAERRGQSVLASVLLGGAGILAGQVASGAGRRIVEAGQSIAVGVLRSYSRENEFEADTLGVRYLSRTGHDPRAMAAFLTKLRGHSRLEARLRGESPDKIDQFNYVATHPAPIERVDRAKRLAASARVTRPIVGRAVYLSKIDGLLYGDDPAQGFIRGRVFAHSEMRYRFEVPPGFRLLNSPTAVMAFGPNGSRIVFGQARRIFGGPVRDYLTGVWARGVRLSRVDTITVNGLEAATGVTRVSTRKGALDARLLAIRVDRKTIYRFLFLTPPALTERLSLGLRRTTYSFRLLRPDEAAALKPQRIAIVRVGPAGTQRGLAARMAFDKFRLERFRALNGIAPDQRLRPGRSVKIVTLGRSGGAPRR